MPAEQEPGTPRRSQLVPREAQFTGSLVGQCLGDALGFPLEGMPPGTCERYVAQELRPRTGRPRGRSGFQPGQYTDDSQLARELLISFVERERFDPADYASRIAKLFASGAIVGRGRATEAAAQRLMAGVSWEASGTPAPAAGNGSAMRAGPVGLLFWDDPERMVQVAIEQGQITHKDPRSSAGAVVIAGAVSLALRPGPIEAAPFVRQLVDWISPVNAEFAGHLASLTDRLSEPPAQSMSWIARAGITGTFDHGWGGISPFVIGSVLWSLYSFLRSPEDYWETMCTAISAGGDVDTTAAMAGAISGAHLGLEAVPRKWAERLQDQGTWGYDRLVGLAARAHRLRGQDSRVHPER